MSLVPKKNMTVLNSFHQNKRTLGSVAKMKRAAKKRRNKKRSKR
tara:strand:+ start:524 stop:655 length:132 start_codon:yes stop_codon:yes gene_type:complete